MVFLLKLQYINKYLPKEIIIDLTITFLNFLSISSVYNHFLYIPATLGSERGTLPSSLTSGTYIDSEMETFPLKITIC